MRSCENKKYSVFEYGYYSNAFIIIMSIAIRSAAYFLVFKSIIMVFPEILSYDISESANVNSTYNLRNILRKGNAIPMLIILPAIITIVCFGAACFLNVFISTFSCGIPLMLEESLFKFERRSRDKDLFKEFYILGEDVFPLLYCYELEKIILTLLLSIISFGPAAAIFLKIGYSLVASQHPIGLFIVTIFSIIIPLAIFFFAVLLMIKVSK